MQFIIVVLVRTRQSHPTEVGNFMIKQKKQPYVVAFIMYNHLAATIRSENGCDVVRRITLSGGPLFCSRMHRKAKVGQKS